jgi:thiol-disulfide isomerase/thioredoxin
MTDDQNSAPSPGQWRGGAMPIYILAAALAAIAGFAVISLVAVPDAGQPVRTVAAEDAAGDAGKPSGLEKLVRVEPASALPDITFVDGEGRDRNLAEWRGKVVLVNLWATWCAPCKREMPGLDRLQAKLGGADFAVLPISLDRTGPEKPRQFLTSNGLKNLGLFLDRGNTLMQTLRVPGLPLSALIDRQGREIARLAGPAEWDSAEAESIIRAAIAKAGDG